MANLSFPPLILTNEGRALIAKGLNGAEIRFSVLRLFSGAAMVAELSAASPVVLESEHKRVLLEFLLPSTQNETLTFDGVGLYAIDPEVGEIRYSHNTAPEPLSLLTTYLTIVPVRTSIGDAENVTVIIEEITDEHIIQIIRENVPPLEFATQDEVDEGIVSDKPIAPDTLAARLLALRSEIDAELERLGVDLRGEADANLLEAMGFAGQLVSGVQSGRITAASGTVVFQRPFARMPVVILSTGIAIEANTTLTQFSFTGSTNTATWVAVERTQ